MERGTVLIVLVLCLLFGKGTSERYIASSQSVSVTLEEDTTELRVLDRPLECPGFGLEFYLGNTEPIPFEVRKEEDFFVNLFMTRPPDAELGDVFYEVLIVCDDGVPPPPATATVSVSITSVNEFSPYSPHDSYTILFHESSEAEDIVGSVGDGDNQYLIIDEDGGADGELSFTLLEDTPNPYFSLDPQTGDIILLDALDYDNTSSGIWYTIHIHGCDTATPSYLCPNVSVTLVLVPANDNDPVFQQSVYIGTIEEGLHRATDINVNISCTDKDVEAGEFDRMEVVSSMLGLAELVYTSDGAGRLLLTGAMDYDSFNNTLFEVVIRCYDKSFAGIQRSSTAIVEIEIVPVNDNIPQFSAHWYNTSVLESLPIGSLVLTLSCVDNDRDVGEFNSISLFEPSPKVNQTFSIDPDNGRMILTAVLDYDDPNNRSHIFSVQCVDDDGLQTVAKIAISTLPTSDEKLILPTPFSFSVDRLTELDSRIGQIVAVDGDKGQDSVIIYSMEDSKLFEIDTDEGYIILIDYLTQDRGSFFNLTVGARDNQGLVEGSVEIIVVGPLSILEVINVVIGVVGMVVVIVIGVLVFVCGYFCLKLFRGSRVDEQETDIAVTYMSGDKIPYQRRPPSARSQSSGGGAKNARERSTLSLQRAKKNKQPQRSFKKKARRRIGLDVNVFENSLQRSRAAVPDEDVLALDMTTFTNQDALQTELERERTIMADTREDDGPNIFNPEDAGLMLGDIMTFPGEEEQTRWGEGEGDLGSWGLVAAELTESENEEENPTGSGQWSPADNTITLID